MEPILISACLLGAACRYDGGSKPVLSVGGARGALSARARLSRTAGRPPHPREPSERQGDLVVMKSSADVTAQSPERRGAGAAPGARIWLQKGRLERAKPQLRLRRNLRRNLFRQAHPRRRRDRALFKKKNGIEVFGERHRNASGAGRGYRIDPVLKRFREVREERTTLSARQNAHSKRDTHRQIRNFPRADDPVRPANAQPKRENLRRNHTAKGRTESSAPTSSLILKFYFWIEMRKLNSSVVSRKMPRNTFCAKFLFCDQAERILFKSSIVGIRTFKRH